MRYELTEHEWAAIKPMPPNKPRGGPRVASPAAALNDVFIVDHVVGCGDELFFEQVPDSHNSLTYRVFGKGSYGFVPFLPILVWGRAKP